MSTGSIQGPRQHRPINTEAASGPSAPAQAAGGAPAASTQAAPANTDSYGAASGGPALGASPGGAARPSGNRSALRAKATSATAPGVGTPDNPAVFDKNGKINIASLKLFGQDDGDTKTTTDDYRCSCNASVAALALQGKDALLAGITNIRSEILKDMVNISDPAGIGKAAGQFPQIIELESKAKAGTLTTKDMNAFAELLAKRYDKSPDSTDKSILKNEDIESMQKALGVMPQSAPGFEGVKGPEVGEKTVFPDGSLALDYYKLDEKPQMKDKFVKDLVGKLGNGQSATVGVYNSGGPDSGVIDHKILMGKDKNGQVYVYDPAGDKDGKGPFYKTGTEALAHLKSKIGLHEGDFTTDSNGKNYTMSLAATFTPLNNKVEVR